MRDELLRLALGQVSAPVYRRLKLTPKRFACVSRHLSSTHDLSGVVYTRTAPSAEVSKGSLRQPGVF